MNTERDKDKLVELGFCAKPHGIKGGFTFTLYNPSESILEDAFEIMLFPSTSDSSVNSEGELHKIAKISFGNKVIVYLEGIADRTEVENMVPFTIQVGRDQFPELSGDAEYYVSDLLGLDVYDHKSQKLIGKLDSFLDNGAQIVFTIKGEDEVWEVLFLEAYFPVVDLENRRVEVIIPSLV